MKKPLALSITCISLLTSPLAQAQSFPQGCYVRDYGADHLAEHPEQGVAGIRLSFDATDLSVSIVAIMSYAGQAQRDGVTGRALTETGLCDSAGRCTIPCDGGALWMYRDEGETILIRTDGARVAERSCDPSAPGSDLAEVPGQVTTYRLTRISSESC